MRQRWQIFMGACLGGNSSMTTVCCVFVRGHVRYTPDYVLRLHAMVKRWMDRPYRFVCLTDLPGLFKGTGIDTIHVEPWKGVYAWWTKIRLFDPSIGLRGRVLYLDLDTLIVGPLAPILDYPAIVALLPHEGKFEGKGQRRVVKRFNSSVMVWDEGMMEFVWNAFNLNVTEHLWGDQDFIGEAFGSRHVLDYSETMPAEWFPRISSIKGEGKIPADARVILAKRPKNIEAARRWSWVREIWRAA